MVENIEQTPTRSAWQKVGIFPHHGINLPLSALRTRQSCGIGEFLDLLPLIDWCHNLKLDFIQLLPLFDSGEDPSPYNPLSSCALNPIYLSLRALPDLNEPLKQELKLFDPFNQTPLISYQAVLQKKLTFLKEYFKQAGEKVLASSEFLDFAKKQLWLESYGCFKKDIPFHSFLQFLCFVQLTTVKQYASSKNVFLEGDIPLFVARDSADVQHQKELFDLTLAAGAPPDAFEKEGQYWGFPLFQWDHQKKAALAWWKQRLSYANHFYDLYRLDHVLGFFRIWTVPLERPAKEGRFLPEKEDLWISRGKDILEQLLSFSSMLPIAEDLGTVPDGVRPCLKELGIPGTKVMRWERNWHTDRLFIPISAYPPLSITCVSTHDLEPLGLWWKNHPDEASLLAHSKNWEYKSNLSSAQRLELLSDSHHTSSLFHANLLQEYLALFPELVWPTLEQERINIPGKPVPADWTYRFRPFLEEITAHQGLQEAMKKILPSSGPSL